MDRHVARTAARGGDRQRRTAARYDLAALLAGDDQTQVFFDADVATITGAAAAKRLALLDGLLTAHGRTTELQHQLGDAAGSIATIAQPTVAGRAAQVFIGHERSVVFDHEVEISNSAAMSNPVVGARRAGLWGCAVVDGDGANQLLTGCWLAVAQAPLTERNHLSDPPATLQLGTAQAATFSWQAPMPFDAVQVLGDGPPWRGKGAAPKLSVQLRRR